MAYRVATKSQWTTLAFVFLTLACLPGVSFGVKVNERSLDVTEQGTESSENNEILQLEGKPINKKDSKQSYSETPIDDVLDLEMEKFEVDAYSMEDKPTKFDIDISDMIHTDHKNLHEAEAERLKNISMKSESSYSMDRMDDGDDCSGGISMACLKEGLTEILENMDNYDAINLTESLQIVKIKNATDPTRDFRLNLGKYDILEKVHRFAKNHVLRISMPNELVTYRQARTFFGGKFPPHFQTLLLSFIILATARLPHGYSLFLMNRFAGYADKKNLLPLIFTQLTEKLFFAFNFFSILSLHGASLPLTPKYMPNAIT